MRSVRNDVPRSNPNCCSVQQDPQPLPDALLPRPRQPEDARRLQRLAQAGPDSAE